MNITMNADTKERLGSDVSFTFLGRVQEIKWNIADGRWQSALALALTLPDICGGIAFPEVVKKYRDGRVMLDRSGNPTRDVGNQYILWFDQYAAPFLRKMKPMKSHISVVNAAGSFGVNTCIKTRASSMMRTIQM